MKPSIPKMNRARRKRLVALGRRTKDVGTALRFHMVAELGTGKSRNAVARLLAVAPSTVVRVARRYVTHGLAGLVDRRNGAARRKVDDTFLRVLREVLAHSADQLGWIRPTWTRELLIEEMKRRDYVVVSVATMGRALRRLGARLGRPKPIVGCPWPARKRRSRLGFLKRLAAADCSSEPVYYVDEVDIDLNPKIGQDWMLRGQQRQVLTPGQNQKHYVAGALRVGTRRLVWVEHTDKSSELFGRLLFRLAESHPRARRIHIILDNYSIHSSKATLRVLELLRGKVELHFLPPYCPDHNPIERVWLDLHASVTRNHRHPTLLDLGRSVINFLDAYDGRGEINPALAPRRAA